MPRDHAVQILVLAGGFDALECLPLERALGRTDVHMGALDTLVKAGADAAQRYDVVLVDCGIQWVRAPEDDVVEALRSYVAKGGRIMLTDLAYPLMEAAWPDLVDFEGPGAAAGKPQMPEAASMGPEGDLRVDVIDDGLARHLRTRRFTATRLQADWAVMRHASPDARVFVDADTGGRRRPIAIAADFPGGGRVVYASFHGHARDADPWKCGEPTGDDAEKSLVYLIAYALAPAQAAAPPRPVAARPPVEIPEPRGVSLPQVNEEAEFDVKSAPAEPAKGSKATAAPPASPAPRPRTRPKSR